MSRMTSTLLCAAVLSAGCTYGEPEVSARVQNVALSEDSRYLAAAVIFERYRPPTGLSAFPDGGVRKLLEQRADLYIIDLVRREIVLEATAAAPESQRSSFSPWIVGWSGTRVYMKITGCPESFRGCGQSDLSSSLYAAEVGGHLEAVDRVDGAKLVDKIVGPSSFAYAGQESYGVSFSSIPGVGRRPLLQFVGERLRVVVP